MEEGDVARVLHDFYTTTHGEISIIKGEIVQVLKVVDKYWCYVATAGRFGNVPTNNLIVIHELPTVADEEELFVASADFHSPHSGDLSFSKGDIIVGVRAIDANWWEGMIAQRSGMFPVTHAWQLNAKHRKKMGAKILKIEARVKMNMIAKLEEEMDLHQGEIVTITEIIDKNWYKGECRDRSGTFPSAYVEIIENKSVDVTDDIQDRNYGNFSDYVKFTKTTPKIPTPDTPPLISFSPEKEVQPGTQTRDLRGLFTDDYFKRNMPSVFQPEIDQKCSSNIEKHEYESQPSTELDVLPYGISLYPFYEQFENELSFHEGEIINLIRHIDKFWMEGTIDGKKGIFPTNYVNILVDCEEQPLVDLETESSAPEVLVPNSFASVMYNFDAQMNGDLTVSENQVVLVLNQLDNEWCEVKDQGGNVGLCPRNHLTAHSGTGGSDRHSLVVERQATVAEDISHDEINSAKLQRSLSVSNKKPLTSKNTLISDDIKRKFDPVQLRNERKNSVDRFPHRPAPPAPVPGQQPLRKTLPRPKVYSTASCTTLVEEQSSRQEVEKPCALEDCRKKNLEQRQNVITELVYTEKEYVRDLKITYETFNLHCPQILESRGIDVKTLFGNILEVMHTAEELLDLLQLAMKGKDDDQQCVGPCFLQMAEQIKNVYGQYCMNHDSALQLLEKYDSNQSIQNLFEKGLETLRYQIACFNMGSILIKPVQRILKYPLILNELIKCTEKNHQDMPTLLIAVKTMTQVASYINECKRRQDIVSKYLEDGNATMSTKMSRLSLHSVAKKSTRLGTLLTSTLGIGVVIKDQIFDEQENMFHAMEKTVTGFARNVESLETCLHEEVLMELDIAESITHFYLEANSVVDHFVSIQRLINSTFWPQFSKMVESRVKRHMNTLLELFQGPSILIQKRHDKLLDYNGCLAKAEKNKDNRLIQEELLAAKSNYEALNSHLLEELPTLLSLASELFIECLGAFVTARKLLCGKITKQYLLLMESQPSKLTAGDNLDVFTVKHSLIVKQFSRLVFASRSFKSDTLPRNIPRRSTTPTFGSQLNDPAQSQSPSQRAYLQSRYPPDKLFQVIQAYTAQDTFQLSVNRGHIVAVIKKQNPMGDSSHWFVDDGAVQGFVASSCLEPIFPPEPQLGRSTTQPERKSITGLDRQPMDRQSVDKTDRQSPVQPNRQPPVQPNRQSPVQPNRQSPVQPNRQSPVQLRPPPNNGMKQTPQSSRGGDFPPSYEEVVYSEVPDEPADHVYEEIPRDETIPEFYYAMFDFNANGPNALTIKTGQVVSVIEKKDLQGNDEWWFVEDRFGTKGYVPGNFLVKYVTSN